MPGFRNIGLALLWAARALASIGPWAGNPVETVTIGQGLDAVNQNPIVESPVEVVTIGQGLDIVNQNPIVESPVETVTIGMGVTMP